MVACKTLGEYKQNQEKIKNFCLEKAKQLRAANKSHPTGEPTHRPNTKNARADNRTSNWSPAKVRKVAMQNQRKQQKMKNPVTPKNTTN